MLDYGVNPCVNWHQVRPLALTYSYSYYYKSIYIAIWPPFRFGRIQMPAFQLAHTAPSWPKAFSCLLGNLYNA